MIYIYDQIVEKDEMEFEYLGETYKLKGVTKTPKSYYLTYMSYGREPVLVMPEFAKQFYEAAKKVHLFKDCKTDRSVRLRLKKAFGKEPEVEEYSLAGTTTYHYTVNYKSIVIYLTLLVHGDSEKFFLQPSFTIAKDNIFGNGNDVDIRNNPMLYKYCDED